MKIKKILIWIGIVFFGLCIAVPIIILVCYKFSHIDQTSTRIFVNNWYYYLILLVGFLGIKFLQDKI